MREEGIVDAKIGRPIPRVEDERLLSGKGRLSDDLDLAATPYRLWQAIDARR